MKLVRLFTVAALLVATFALSLGARAQDGASLVIAWAQPANQPSAVATAAFSAYYDNFFANEANIGLIKYGADFNPSAYMIAEIPTVDNGLVVIDDAGIPAVTFSLKPNMVWSDGNAIDADDIIFVDTLLRQPNPVDSLTRTTYLLNIASVTKVDDLTVTVQFATTYADYLLLLPNPTPSHKFLGDNAEGWTIDTDGDGVFDNNYDDYPGNRVITPGETIGYGPYVISEFVPDTSTTFTLNPNWGKNEWEKVPAFTSVTTVVIQEAEQMQNALEVGDVDFAFNFSTDQKAVYEEMENVSVYFRPSVFQDAIWFNISDPAFPGLHNASVREALATAINRQAIIDTFAPGVSLNESYYPAQFIPEDIALPSTDVEAARAMLTEAGWVDDDADESAENNAPTPRVSAGVEGVEDGTPFVIKFFTTVTNPRPIVQQLIQADWAKVGVATQIFAVPGGTVFFASFNQRGILATRDFDVAMYALSNNPLSPNTSRANFYCSGIPSADNTAGQNYTGFCNEEYERLSDLVETTVDPVQRKEYSDAAIRIFADAYFLIPIRPRPEGYAVRSDRVNPESVQEMGTLSNNNFQNIVDWVPAG
jgi:peptide/nickel transport system substrate-binding protein